jgi:hypothetical protein
VRINPPLTMNTKSWVDVEMQSLAVVVVVVDVVVVMVCWLGVGASTLWSFWMTCCGLKERVQPSALQPRRRPHG